MVDPAGLASLHRLAGQPYGVEDIKAPIVPVYLDGLWGSVFSFHGGKFFWKWPRAWPYPVSISFGEPVARPAGIHRLRRAVQDLGAFAVRHRTHRTAQLARDFVRTCKRRLRRSKVADSTGVDLSGGGLLARTLILRRLLRRHVLADEESCVGVLLPPSAAAVAVNAALAMDQRVAVNLNYSVTSSMLNSCLRQCGAKHVLSSRKFLNKLNLHLDVETVCLEDFQSKTTLADKVIGGLQAYAMPSRLLERWLGLHRAGGDDLLTVIFTSGSTGDPKGVMLTHANVAANVEAVEQAIRLSSRDVLVGVLPFFHSFGYTITMWTVLAIDIKGIYHFSPLDGRQVGRLCQEHGGTALVATPTFLRNYLRRCDKEMFASLEVVVAGAEKLPSELCDAFEEKFGVRPVEGYGTTELAPLVSVNVPANRSPRGGDADCKEGTVGRPTSGVSAKVVHLETGEELGPGQTGMLLVTGPNVMRGYWSRPDLTAEVMRDGWYVTGDIARLDEQGFIHITGRESRFSKIGGEMVPHIRIEEALSRILGVSEEDGPVAVVTAVPDAKKGERLVVLHTKIEQTPEFLTKALGDQGFPGIYIPSVDSYCQVEKLPVLGTGKLDLKAIRDSALEKFGQRSQLRTAAARRLRQEVDLRRAGVVGEPA